MQLEDGRGHGKVKKDASLSRLAGPDDIIGMTSKYTSKRTTWVVWWVFSVVGFS